MILKSFLLQKGSEKSDGLVKEIPVYEITGIENFGMSLSVTWKGFTNTFFMMEKADSLVNWVMKLTGCLRSSGNCWRTMRKSF